MPSQIKTKRTFGTVRVDHFSPPLDEGKPVPKAINIILSFEEALKLQIGLQSILVKLNSHNRNTKTGLDSGIDQVP